MNGEQEYPIPPMHGEVSKHLTLRAETDLDSLRARVIACRTVCDAVEAHIFTLCRREGVPYSKFSSLKGNQAKALRTRRGQAKHDYEEATRAYRQAIGTDRR